VKTIVCYGDSNTWGADPAGNGRFDHTTRWPGVMAGLLGEGYRVIEEALNGRTTIVDDPISPNRNGLTYLMPCLDSHHPFDLVTIMLGTNDLKFRLNRTAADIGESVMLLAETARNTPFGPDESRPKVLIICPPPVALLTDLDGMFVGAVEKSLELPRYYELAAKWAQCDFLNAGDIIRSSDLDGIHFEASEHAKLGQAVAVKVRQMLEG
jgi:lysophospholipase L1-like esterase